MGSRVATSSSLRGYRRRRTGLNLDLNDIPPVENRDLEGISSQAIPQQIDATQQGQDIVASQQAQEIDASQQAQAHISTTIDVEEIDDDVVFSTPTAFAEARRKSRRNQAQSTVVDVDLDYIGVLNSFKRRRSSANSTFIGCDVYINLENSSDSMKEVPKPVEPPPKEPTFSCPICMGPFVEETSTKCGHIFCKSCIKTAVSAQSKCPTCRKRVYAKDLIRVYLPTTR